MQKESRCVLGSFTYAWEKRKLGELLINLQNNTISRTELSYEKGVAINVHYGEVLIEIGEYIDVKKAPPLITNSLIVTKYKTLFLQNGDVIVADTAEDEIVDKCREIAISGLYTIPYYLF